jgi:glycosyltransferase domain-containing protein
MLVTIGIPIYNRVDGFERALQSILAQSYQNLEILLSNDCSPSTEIDLLAKQYASNDSRIKYFYQEKSLKAVNNFSFLKNNAKGKYFLWLADDDWLDDNYIEKCVDFLENNTSYTLACGLCSYHENEKVVISINTNLSIEQESYWSRLYNYFRKVTLNGYFYGVMRTELISDFVLPNQLGFDWNIIAYLCFRGKIKTVDSTKHHLSKGGMSNEGSALAGYFGKKNFMSKYLIGLSTSINCAKNIFDSKHYNLSFINKLFLSLYVFFTAYLNVIHWDIILLKRVVLKWLHFSSDGVLFKFKKYK